MPSRPAERGPAVRGPALRDPLLPGPALPGLALRGLSGRRLLLLVPAALAACQTPPTNPMAERIAAMQARGVVLRVLFAFNSYAIREQDRPTLDNLAAALADPRLARFRFEINGHTDVAGRLGYNLALSELRAASVVDYLAGRGVERARLKPQGFGPLQLLDPANPRSEVNRRVEVFAVPPAPAS